jgi:hypothetical protein
VRSSHRRLPLFLAPLAALVATAAHARPPEKQEDNLLNDRFGLQAGVAYSATSTNVRFDSDAGTPGTELNGEDDLGLGKNKVLARGEVWFRMKERHRARISSYFIPLNRRANTVLDRTIQFGNETFDVNEAIESEIRLNLLAITYAYSFVKNDRLELGASLGFDVVEFEGKATVPARLRTEREERSGPAPLVGLDGTVRIHGKWYAEARAQYLKVNISDVKGTLTTYDLNVLYRLHPNVTVGLGYSGFGVNVDSANPGDSGRIDITTHGPVLFGRVGF